MKKFIFTLSALLLISAICYSQPVQEWERIYGNANSCDLSRDNEIDNNGNIYVTGATQVAPMDHDIITIKYNSAGVQQWVVTYSSPGIQKDLPSCVKVDNSGNVYVAGRTMSAGGYFEATIIKYNSSGVLQWIDKHAEPSYYYTSFNSIEIDNSGNIAAIGSSSTKFIVIKYNPAGTRLWSSIYWYPLSSVNSCNASSVDNNGNIYLCGQIHINNINNGAIIKYSPSGVQEWIVLYNPGGSPYFLDITNDNSGNIYVTGSLGLQGFHQLITLKYNPQGINQWTYILPNNNEPNIGDKIAVDNLNNVYVAGDISLSPTERAGTALFKFNQSGALQWMRFHSTWNTIPGMMDIPTDLKFDRWNNVYISALTFKFAPNTVDNKTKIIKYNSNGEQKWVYYKDDTHLDSNGFNGRPSILLNDSGNIFLSTGGLGNPELAQIHTVKYSQLTRSVSGTVTYRDNNELVTEGLVKALYYDYSSLSIITVDSTIINSNGTYTLTKVPPDSVFIMFYQNDDLLDFVPTYHESTIDWREAQKIYPIQNMTDINCRVFRINNGNNPYTINGRTFYNSTGDALTPITDAVIYAMSGTTYKNYGISYGGGNYTVTKLAPGTYTLIGHRIGFNPVTQNVTITQNSLQDINVIFGDPIGIEPISTEIPSSFKLYQNYPNPFNPVTKIKFDLPKEVNVKITVFDILGREVVTLVNGDLKAGTYSVDWNAANAASGIYFYNIKTSDYTQTLKMVVVK